MGAPLSRGGDGPPARPAIVVSHERSGTHFLMNTLALNFGYLVKPWVDLDFNLAGNFHYPKALALFFTKLHAKKALNMVKSHHQAGFLTPFMEQLVDKYFVFYAYRDPRDVMVSYWRYIRRVPWDEGPNTETVGEFMRAAPRGAMLRYQKMQIPTILERWKVHVEEWAACARAGPRTGVTLVRYEDLNRNFEETVAALAERIGRPCPEPKRPDREVNVVLPGAGSVGGHRDVFAPEDHAFVRAAVGDTMERLEIPWERDGN